MPPRIVSFSILLRQRHARGLLRRNSPHSGWKTVRTVSSTKAPIYPTWPCHHTRAKLTFHADGHIRWDGTSTTSSNRQEQTLDMGRRWEWPRACDGVQLRGSTDTAILSAMVANTVAPISKQIGCSWGWTADVSTLNPYFEQMGTQDQKLLCGLGRSGYWHGTGNSAPCRRTMPMSLASAART